VQQDEDPLPGVDHRRRLQPALLPCLGVVLGVGSQDLGEAPEDLTLRDAAHGPVQLDVGIGELGYPGPIASLAGLQECLHDVDVLLRHPMIIPLASRT
jgi:hypothetical protein